MLNVCSVVSLIIVIDDCDHHGVICKLYDGVRPIHRHAVMAEGGVEERAQHTALLSLEGMTVLNAELKSTKSILALCVLVVQV